MSLTSQSFGRTIIALITAGFAALIVIGGMSLWLVLRNRTYADLVTHTQEVRTQTYRILTLTQEAEAGQRGYLLTGNEQYLDRYREALPQLPEAVDTARALVRDNPQQQAHVARLSDALRIKLAELKETIELAQAGRRDEALAIVRSDRGRDSMRIVRTSVADMLVAEERLLQDRGDELYTNGVRLLIANMAALLLIGAVALGSGLIVRRYLTELTAAQTELADVNAGLEEAVKERTADLTRANEEVQRFAYIVSHDLRAPLVNIMGFTSELDAARGAIARQIEKIEAGAPELIEPEARVAAAEDLPEAIGFIRSSTTKMDRLINAILNLSRDGRRVLTPERVDMGELVQGIAASIHQQTSGVEAEIVIEEDLPMLVTDRLAVEQVFSNLIENAVKYLDPKRPGRVVVKGRMNGAMVRYDVEDNGRGIDAKDHERVFELFRRSGAQDRTGEGLGLTFVRSSVRRLGGSISLASELGRGSTFSLEFPKFLQRSREAT